MHLASSTPSLPSGNVHLASSSPSLPSGNVHLASSTPSVPSGNVHLASSSPCLPSGNVHLASSTPSLPSGNVHLASSTPSLPPGNVHLASSTPSRPSGNMHLASSSPSLPPDNIHLASTRASLPSGDIHLVAGSSHLRNPVARRFSSCQALPMRALVSASLSALLLASACAPVPRAPTAAPSVAPPPAPPPVAPSAAPDALAAPAAVTLVSSTPDASAWPGAGQAPARAPFTTVAADDLAIAQTLCEASPVRAQPAGFTCACPAGMELSGQMTIAERYPGHFSGPDRDEVVVATRGCETGASSGQTYGGRAVLRRTPEGWRKVFYAAGALGSCTPFRSPAGRSRLVCHLAGGHMGDDFDQLVLVGFDTVDGAVKEERSPILDLVSSVPPPSAPGPAYREDLQRHAVTGVAAYEAGDAHSLGVDASVRSRVECTGAPSTCPGVATSTEYFSIHFFFDGAAFRVAKASTKAFSQMKAREKP